MEPIILAKIAMLGGAFVFCAGAIAHGVMSGPQPPKAETQSPKTWEARTTDAETAIQLLGQLAGHPPPSDARLVQREDDELFLVIGGYTLSVREMSSPEFDPDFLLLGQWSDEKKTIDYIGSILDAAHITQIRKLWSEANAYDCITNPDPRMTPAQCRAFRKNEAEGYEYVGSFVRNEDGSLGEFTSAEDEAAANPSPEGDGR